jgi:hypothetical protein
METTMKIYRSAFTRIEVSDELFFHLLKAGMTQAHGVIDEDLEQSDNIEQYDAYFEEHFYNTESLMQRNHIWLEWCSFAGPFKRTPIIFDMEANEMQELDKYVFNTVPEHSEWDWSVAEIYGSYEDFEEEWK